MKSANDRDEVVAAEDFVFFTIDLDLRTSVFGDEDTITNFDFKGDLRAIFTGFAGSEGLNDAFTGFFFAESGIIIPPFLTSFSSPSSTRTRSPRGFTFSAMWLLCVVLLFLLWMQPAAFAVGQKCKSRLVDQDFFLSSTISASMTVPSSALVSPDDLDWEPSFAGAPAPGSWP